MRILRYAKNVKLGTYLDYKLVPEQEITEEALRPALFNVLCEHVRQSGFDYVILDRNDVVTERRVEGE